MLGFQVWLKMFRDTVEFVLRNTEKAGRMMEGANWQGLDFLSMLEFHTNLLSIATAAKSNIEDFFKGGSKTRQPRMKRNMFRKVFQSLKTYDEAEEWKKGMCNKNNKESYDSLWKCRTLWRMAMLSFQQMRNPPRCLSLDESMSKYTVSNPNIHLSI